MIPVILLLSLFPVFLFTGLSYFDNLALYSRPVGVNVLDYMSRYDKGGLENIHSILNRWSAYGPYDR